MSKRLLGDRLEIGIRFLNNSVRHSDLQQKIPRCLGFLSRSNIFSSATMKQNLQAERREWYVCFI
uniref:Uncharacterized protein n=1 Tax=Picea glauca TaxID=3330 RepID=A0A101M0Z4_PICGL|nr:hypothetical protein ABT39_MTgene4358 [Picea glauca]